MLSKEQIKKIIKKECYEGIRDQDGFETLELTVRHDQKKEVADQILKELDNG